MLAQTFAQRDARAAGDELDVLSRLMAVNVLCSIDVITWEYHDYLFPNHRQPERMYSSDNHAPLWDFIFAHQAIEDEDAQFASPQFKELRQIWKHRVAQRKASANRQPGCRTRFVARDDEIYHRR